MNWELLYKIERESNEELIQAIRANNRYIKELQGELEELKASKSIPEKSLGLVDTLKAQETPITINIYT